MSVTNVDNGDQMCWWKICNVVDKINNIKSLQLKDVTNLTVTDQLWRPAGLTSIKSFSSDGEQKTSLTDVLEVARPIDNRFEVQNHSSNSVSFQLKLLFIVAVGIEKCRYKYNAI